jgi:hypothetical protein
MRKNFYYLPLFNDYVVCEAALRRSHTQITVIDSGQVEWELILCTHYLPQLTNMFVYYMNKQINAEWSQSYEEVT